MNTADFLIHRILSCVALSLAACALMPSASAADPWPSRPLRLVVPYPPGGMGDTVARALAPRWGAALGQSIVIDNRGGAGSNIGIDAVAKAAPDGYTLGLFDTAMVVNPSLYSKLPYDAERDLLPLMVVARGPLVLAVGAAQPASTIAELLQLARSRPGTLSYASAGIGTPVHLAGEMLRSSARIDIVHVPYKGAGPAVVDVVGGQVPMLFALPGTVSAHIAAGRLRPLAITGDQRFDGLPQVPTFIESGLPGIDATLIVGFMVPAQTPSALVDRLRSTLAGVVQADATEQDLGKLALRRVASTPHQTLTILAAEKKAWALAVKTSGARAD